VALSTDQIDRAGIHAVGGIFTRLKWVFREQATSDYGIDAQAEKLNEDGSAGGKLIGLQIKTGASHFRKRGDGYVFYGEARHRKYWANYSLPVFLVLHNPDTGLTLWQRIEEHLIEDGKDGRWAIAIPADQTLDEKHESYIAAGIASDLASMRRARLALDLPSIRQFAEQDEIYLRIEDWVNKTLNFRGVEAVFNEEPDAEADLFFDVAMSAYTVDYFMAVFFPWLDWSEHEYHDADEGAGEVAVHVLKVELSAIARAAITLDDFFRSELPPFRPEPKIQHIFLREDEFDDPDYSDR
jgi:hypothetical protein